MILTFVGVQPRRMSWCEQGFSVGDGQQSGCVGCPVNAVDDDAGVRSDFPRKVRDVPLWMLVKLGGVKTATVFPLKLILSPDLQNREIREVGPHPSESIGRLIVVSS